MIKYGKEDEKMDLEILSLDQEKRRFGLKMNQTIFLATMVDLPCIIEAMKTLDNFNFYKSQDASQLLYVHPKKIEEVDKMKNSELLKIVGNYDPIKEDSDFVQTLYERTKVNEQVTFKLRDGISPVAKNVRNIRYKKKP